MKKDVLKSFTKFGGKHLCQSLFFDKVVDCRLWHWRFPANFEKFLRTPFLQNTSSGCFCIVLMLISYSLFYGTNFTNNLCSVDISVSANSNINGLSINIFDKDFNFSFFNSSRLPYEVRKYKKITLLAPKNSNNSDNMNILSFFFIFLLSFSFLRKRKNDPRVKIVLTNIAFLVYILYRFSNPQNRLESCFACQFFTHDTIDITNEVNTSYFQSELSIFTIF